MPKFQILMGAFLFLQAVVIQSTLLCQGSEPMQWTQWYDRDDPTYTGDYETLAEISKQSGFYCYNPVAIECLTLSGISANLTGEKVVCDPKIGFQCINSDQPDKICNYDYKVRFGCCYGCIQNQTSYWTEWFDRDQPSGDGDFQTLVDLRRQGKQICEKPIDYRCQSTEGHKLYQMFEYIRSSKQYGCACIGSEQQRGYCSYDLTVKFRCCK